jgi:hypothetical protein
MSNIAAQLAALPTSARPRLKPNHRLSWLTRCDWGISYEIALALLEWGYALPVGFEPTHYSAGAWRPDAVGQTSTNFGVTTTPRKCAEYAKAHSGTPTYAYIYRSSTNAIYKATMREDAWLHNSSGARIPVLTLPAVQSGLMSPLAPDAALEDEARYSEWEIQQIRAVCPINLLLHQAENDLAFPSSIGMTVFPADPQVAAALAGLSDAQKQAFWTGHKRRQMLPIVSTASAAADGAPTVLYRFGDPMKYVHTGVSTWSGSWDFTLGHDGVLSYPSFQLYYPTDSKWVYQSGGVYDALSLMLAGMHQGIAAGHPLGYHWLAGGWHMDGTDSPLRTLMGFLKGVYMAGAMGCTVGWFGWNGAPVQSGHNNEDVGSTSPQWIEQAKVHGHVHALWTWLDDWLINATLLDGTATNVVGAPKSYEFTDPGDPTCRVMARKHNDRDEWLLFAWAADNIDRYVTVTIPTLGSVMLYARGCGSIYSKAVGGNLLFYDYDENNPSQGGVSMSMPRNFILTTR